MRNHKINYIMLLDDTPENLFMNNRLNIDLFYNFANYAIELPPIRHNIKDLKHLILTFTSNYCDYIGVPQIVFTASQIEKLCIHRFPGNMNELGIFITEIASSFPSEEELDEKIDKLLASSYKFQTNSLIDSKNESISLSNLLSETNAASLTEMLEMIEKQIIKKTKAIKLSYYKYSKKFKNHQQNLNYKLKKYDQRF